MAVRPTMQAIIDTLRQYGQAATDDEFDGIVYWTDAQLQQIADQNSRRGTLTLKSVDPANFEYQLVAPRGVMLEDTIKVYNQSQVLSTAPFAYNPDTNLITFDDAQTSSQFAAYGAVVDINEALAQLWQNKADQRFNYIDWKAQNNKMNMAQEYQHCVDRALFYRSKKIRTFDRKGRGKWFNV